MNNEVFNVMRIEHTAIRFVECDKKSKDYATEQDRLSNFKRAGARLGIEPEKILMVFAQKHWTAIEAYIKGGCQDTGSESIIGRIYDLQNYLDLLLGQIEEREANVAK